MVSVGKQMYSFLKELFPVNRSLTGNGVRETLKRIQEIIPIGIEEVPSGTVAFDWSVPNEWNISEAFIEDPGGDRVVDFKVNNLHVVGYSVPVDCTLTLEELQKRLYSIPEMPDAIPYVTSYYKESWGFCIAHNQRMQLKEGNYRVVIRSSLLPGHLSYGELLIKGKSDKEIFLTSYVCHPSMANNELSGPVLLTWLAKALVEQDNYYSYRIVFAPETIGAIVYLSRHLEEMKSKVIAGFVLSCVGDERAWSVVSSRYSNTYADHLLASAFSDCGIDAITYSYLDRGSDERQYGAPGIDLPVVTFCRSKFGEYPEYHTSLDDLNLVTARGLEQSYDLMMKVIGNAESNRIYRVKTLCEPQLGKRGLYPTLSTRESIHHIRNMRNVIAYLDGRNDIYGINRITGIPQHEIREIIDRLMNAGLIEAI